MALLPDRASSRLRVEPTEHLGRSISYPQIVARYGASDRVDVGALGGIDLGAKYGVAGFDTRIALLRQ